MNGIIKNQLKILKFKYFFIIVIYLVNISLTIYEAVLFGNILDLIINNNGHLNNEIIFKIGLFLLLLLIQYVSHYIYRIKLFPLSKRFKQEVIKKIFDKIKDSNISFFRKMDKGNFLSYIINDISHISSIMSHGVIELTRVLLVTIVGCIISIFFIDFWLTILVFFTFPIYIYLILRINKKAQDALYRKKTEEAEMLKVITDNFSGFSVIKSFVKEENVIKEFEACNENLKNAGVDYNKVTSSINSFSYLFKGFSLSITILLGLYLVIEGNITIGSFVAFNSIVQKVTKDYIYAGHLISKFNYIKIINKRINTLYNTETSKKGKVHISSNITLSIKNMSFKYEDSNDYIFKNVNLIVKQGNFIGIVGNTASGKTTLANILSKFVQIPDGMIYLNDVDINNVSNESYYNELSYMMQNDYIFDNTVNYNVKLTKNYSEKLIDKSLESAELLSTIKNFPNKNETSIGDNGIKLSGGQKQRLIVARNLVKKPGIIIIDSALTGLDIITRKKVVENIRKEYANTTIILITSILSDVSDADSIYKLENNTLRKLHEGEIL